MIEYPWKMGNNHLYSFGEDFILYKTSLSDKRWYHKSWTHNNIIEFLLIHFCKFLFLFWF